MNIFNTSSVYVYYNGQWVKPLVYKRINGVWVLMSAINLVVTLQTLDNFNLDMNVMLSASVVESNKEIL